MLANGEPKPLKTPVLLEVDLVCCLKARAALERTTIQKLCTRILRRALRNQEAAVPANA